MRDDVFTSGTSGMFFKSGILLSILTIVNWTVKPCNNGLIDLHGVDETIRHIEYCN